ncbi:MAG TPA: LeuA family protein [Pseudomonadota bacterium]|jgi:2-isopropylmalate synthase|nr:LeuA family protein [Pseudomonadota bacterium]HNK46751.1 LeuA family protein [Pseudomonadota bacterium]HNN53429.1 LeuA family protein [Pseudomonadota bacterium]HNO67990.1 LeuA family protein [Pseudomonadota bacterium]
MTQQAASDIIYDWNLHDTHAPLWPAKFSLFDETLRDGLQSPSVHDPSIEDKIQLVLLLDRIGVEYVDIALPGAGPRAVEDGLRLACEIRDRKLRIRPACAARTHLNDVRPIVEISQKAGIAIEVMTFIGSSPIRQFAENWDKERILKMSAEAVSFAAQNNLPCTYVTEDTIRSRPEMLAPLFKNAIDSGAHRLCLCDTVGHATPTGVDSLVRFARSVIVGMGLDGKIGIDWHGHNDRGLAVINSLSALRAGADRIHGTVLGVGERVGNAALDQLLVNLYLMGALPDDRDLSSLDALCTLISRACQVPIPYNYPVFGTDAFRTATGVHAAAIIKAERKGDAFLADRIYSGVPAAMFGRRQEIEIGPMSGESNVAYWLQRNGIAASQDAVKRVFAKAKSANRLLSTAEILAVVQATDCQST